MTMCAVLTPLSALVLENPFNLKDEDSLMMTSCADPTFSYQSRESPFYPGSVNSELGIFTGVYPDVGDVMDAHFSPDLSFLFSMDQYCDSVHNRQCSDDLSSEHLSYDSDKDVVGGSDGNISDDNSLTDAVISMCSQSPLQYRERGPPPPYEPPHNNYPSINFSTCPSTNTITNNNISSSQTKMPETIKKEDNTEADETKFKPDIKIKQETFSPETETTDERKGRPPRSCHSMYSASNCETKQHKKVHKPRVKKTIHLWEFLEEIVENKAYSPKYITWVSRDDGVFRLVDSKAVAKLWGQRKNRHDMTYEKMSRAIRYYYERGIIRHVIGQKLIYQFGDEINEKRRDKVPTKITQSLEESSQVQS